MGSINPSEAANAAGTRRVAGSEVNPACKEISIGKTNLMLATLDANSLMFEISPFLYISLCKIFRMIFCFSVKGSTVYRISLFEI